MPLLVYSDLSKPIMLYTDASDRCIGAVLTLTLSSAFRDLIKMASDREGGVHHPVCCAEVGLLSE